MITNKTTAKTKTTVNICGFEYTKKAVQLVRKVIKSDKQTQDGVFHLLLMISIQDEMKRNQARRK